MANAKISIEKRNRQGLDEKWNSSLKLGNGTFASESKFFEYSRKSVQGVVNKITVGQFRREKF